MEQRGHYYMNTSRHDLRFVTPEARGGRTGVLMSPQLGHALLMETTLPSGSRISIGALAMLARKNVEEGVTESGR